MFQLYWTILSILFHLCVCVCVCVCVCMLFTQSCPILCNPMDCSPPDSFIHGILQARKPEWVVTSPEDLLNPGILPRSAALQAYSLSSKPPGKSFFYLLVAINTIQCVGFMETFNPPHHIFLFTSYPTDCCFQSLHNPHFFFLSTNISVLQASLLRHLFLFCLQTHKSKLT